MDASQTSQTSQTDTVTARFAAYVAAHTDKVTENYATDLDVRWQQTLTTYVSSAIADAEAKRQAVEDERANKRNFNRMLTLLCALLIGIVVTWTLSHNVLGNLGHDLAPYSFVITIILDSSLAIYSMIKHY